MDSVEDWTVADVVAMIGAPWNPPPADRPAARALYFIWVDAQIAAAVGEPCALQWLLAGGVPDALNDLQRETYDLRRKYDAAELCEMAKQEISVNA